MATTQTAVSVSLAAGGGLVAIINPRLKGASPARCRLVKGPGVIEVSSGRRTDTICMSDDVIEFSQAGASFRGRVGVFVGQAADSLVVIDDGQVQVPTTP